MRLINADALRTRLEENRAIAASDNDLRSMYYALGVREAILIVGEFPTIDPESLREKAYWIAVEEDILFKCSRCECQVSTSWDYDCDCMFDYCPNCGAKMDAEET